MHRIHCVSLKCFFFSQIVKSICLLCLQAIMYEIDPVFKKSKMINRKQRKRKEKKGERNTETRKYAYKSIISKSECRIRFTASSDEKNSVSYRCTFLRKRKRERERNSLRYIQHNTTIRYHSNKVSRSERLFFKYLF